MAGGTRKHDAYSERETRRRRRRTEDTSHADAPDIERLRQARTTYYSLPAEERRRGRTTRMAHETETRSRKSSSRKHAGSEYSRRKHHSGEKRRSSGKDRELRDSGVFVYGTADTRENADAGRTPLAARHSVRLSRSGTQRTSRAVTAPEVSRHSRTELLGHARRATHTGVGGEPVASSASIHRAEAPKLGRSTSVRNSSRSVMTRPSLRRSNTTKVRGAADVITPPPPPAANPAPSVTGKAPASMSPAKERRSTGGLFSFLRPPPPPAPEKKYDCIVCMDDVPASRCPKLSCGHRMCHTCIKRQFELSVKDPQHMPPTCCTTEHIPLKHVERLLDTKFKILWNRKYQEYTTKNRIYCPTKGCGEWIKPTHIHMDPAAGRKYAKCTRCKTKVCALCNGKWHGSKECPKDDEAQKFADMAKTAGWQRCYNCKAMVELKEGCNHMTCRCTAQFCMLCGAKWKSCDCPWFNYAHLDDDDRLPFNEPYVVIQRDHQQGPQGQQSQNQNQNNQLPLRPFPDAYPAPPRRPNHPIYGNNIVTGAPRGRSPAPNHNTNTDDDERLARRLQTQLLLDPATATANEARPRRRAQAQAQPQHQHQQRTRPNSPALDIEVLGIGNAAGHHMNEFGAPAAAAATTATGTGTGRMRRSRTMRERARAQAQARNGERGGDAVGGAGSGNVGRIGGVGGGLTRHWSVHRGTHGRGTGTGAEASVMAGLTEPAAGGEAGGGGGMRRVGAWLRYVEDDPAEVEGRGLHLRRGRSLRV